MAKDPAFLFYPGDWLSGTMYLTHEQKGAYMDLLILQFNCGKFTEAQAKQVLSICFDVAWPMLKQKFILDKGLYFNARLQSEIEKRKAFTESRRNNAKGSKSTKIDALLDKSENKAYAKHMEDEDINENKEEIKTEKQIILKQKQDDLISSILLFFGYSSSFNKKQQSLTFDFVSTLEFHGRLDFVINEFKSYSELKKLDGYPHKLENFIGDQSDQFKNGKWDDNWTEHLKAYKIKNGMESVTSNGSKPKETVIQKMKRQQQEKNEKDRK